jgi:hypothetical protein
VMNVVWNHLLPAMKADALPANDADRKKLSDRLGNLEVRRAEGSAAPKLASSISGKRYSFEKNPAGLTALAVDWRSQRGTPVIKMAFEGADQQVVCSKNEWIKGRASFGHGSGERLVAATCAWKSGDTFTAKIVQPETPYYYDLNLRFAGQEAILDARTSVSKPGEALHLVGKAQ